MSGRDKCMPPTEFQAHTINRCEVEFTEPIMDDKNYLMFWHPYNFTKSRQDRYGIAFLYQTPNEARVYSKMGKSIFHLNTSCDTA